ncbi:P2X purinoceptor 7-like [Paramisgurnus dabryanus]|uniref:P2X purinoceptor 7-like n=1 Tax=Paramisgurnus dabryanus TaxID=90735 RepID=UPI002435CA18|nr:P2X purinoceptor 7-like [Misgurnus anguillicaudatus]
MQARLQSLEADQRDGLLQLVLDRLPGLLFDLLALQDNPQIPPVTGHMHWCVCSNCRDMPTDIERLCCGQHPDSCISKLPHMDFYILDEGVLRLARAAWNDIFAVDDVQEPGEEQRSYRHAAYRNFVLWQHGRLGEGNRTVIASCVVWRIRDKYPDANGQYTGFRVRRLP